jgi:hypothetical protein
MDSLGLRAPLKVALKDIAEKGTPPGSRTRNRACGFLLSQKRGVLKSRSTQSWQSG